MVLEPGLTDYIAIRSYQTLHELHRLLDTAFRVTLPGSTTLQVLEEKFDAFSREIQSLGQAKVQALMDLVRSLEKGAPRYYPQIQAQKSRIEATWERLNKTIKVRTEVGTHRPGWTG